MLAVGFVLATLAFGFSGVVPRSIENPDVLSRLSANGLSKVTLTEQLALVNGWFRPTVIGVVTLTQGPAQPNGVQEAGQVARVVLEEVPDAQAAAQIAVVVQVVKTEKGRPGEKVLYSYRHVASPEEWSRKVGAIGRR
jgi:hypothetical protein